MKSDGHPQIPGSSQQEAEEQSSQARVNQSQPVLTGISQVTIAKECRDEKRGGPEADTLGEHEQTVAAKVKLLCQGNQEEGQAIEAGKSQALGTGESNSPEIEDSHSAHSNEQHRKRCEPEQGSLPELTTEHAPPGQAVIGDCPLFDPRHDPTGKQEEKEVHDVADHLVCDVIETVFQGSNKLPVESKQYREDGNEDQQAPSRPQTVSTIKVLSQGRSVNNFVGFDFCQS